MIKMGYSSNKNMERDKFTNMGSISSLLTNNFSQFQGQQQFCLSFQIESPEGLEDLE